MISRLNNTRNRLLCAIASVWLVVVAAILVFNPPAPGENPVHGEAKEQSLTSVPPQEYTGFPVVPTEQSPHVAITPATPMPIMPPKEPVVVSHWASSHLMREGLLPEMAAQFNQLGHQTRSGRPVTVKVHDVPPALQAEYLVCRAMTQKPCQVEPLGIPTDPNIPDPTIVTPSSAHWFIQVNYKVGHNVVDLSTAPSIVRPFIGIVTYQDMAKCLGWPEKELGYADILALRADPEGWGSYDCAKVEWGQRPRVAYTDPTTSSTGRSLLLGLYAIAAGKPPDELTLEDVNNQDVVQYIKEFQGLIDHYAIGTTVLNTKIYQGPRYGHFFIMPEDNLIHLYNGTEEAYRYGKVITAPPIQRDMVMIYPKEGAMPRTNCACIVQEEWVTEEHREGAQQWIDFLLQEEQQRVFMAAGFRPGIDIELAEPIGPSMGLDPRTPPVIINPSLIDPEIAAAIDGSWEDVKRPGIVTLVVDTSSSMAGAKLNQAADGVVRFLDNTSQNNQVGLVTFNETLTASIEVAPLIKNRFKIADTVGQSRAEGQSALYDAIKAGIEMTDRTEGEAQAIRGVVVLTDGEDTISETRLHDLIVMRSEAEGLVKEVWDEQDGYQLADLRTGSLVDEKEVSGIRLALKTSHPIQIFFIGIGENLDLEVGRLLAEATDAEPPVGTIEEDLPRVIEQFGKYF